MIRLTDITLSCLDVYDPTGEQLSQLCGLLLNIGADYTELSVKAFRKMGALPPGGRYILRCESIMQAREYPQFGTYVCHRTGRCAPAGLISENPGKRHPGNPAAESIRQPPKRQNPGT